MAGSSVRHSDFPASHHALLRSCCYPVVSTVRADGLLSVNPVSMLWQGGYIRFSTLKDRVKYKNLLADSRISVCVTATDNPLHYLELRGHAVLEDDDDYHFVNQIAQKYLGVPEYPYDPPGAQRVTVTVHHEQISTPRMGKVGAK